MLLACSVAELQSEPTSGARPLDGSDFAVGAAEALVVAQGHDLVADRVVRVVVAEGGGAEVAVVGQGLAGSVVEVGDGASSAGVE